MATLDDKLLGEKLHYYCSSSEDEGDSGDEGGGRGGGQGQEQKSQIFPDPEDGHNTGPKGVLSDWRRYKQLETEKREDAEMERLALAQKLSFTCRTEAEDRKEANRERELEEDLEALLDDDFLESYMAKRMEEMMAKRNMAKKFGSLLDLADGDSFLKAVDDEDKSVTVIILIHEPGAEGCQAMSGCLSCLATDFPTVKFCKIRSSAAGLSQHFKSAGLPALLVYKEGQVIGSFLRMTDQLGTDFFAPDLESILNEHGFLPDRDSGPRNIRGPADPGGDSDGE